MQPRAEREATQIRDYLWFAHIANEPRKPMIANATNTGSLRVIASVESLSGHDYRCFAVFEASDAVVDV